MDFSQIDFVEQQRLDHIHYGIVSRIRCSGISGIVCDQHVGTVCGRGQHPVRWRAMRLAVALMRHHLYARVRLQPGNPVAEHDQPYDDTTARRGAQQYGVRLNQFNRRLQPDMLTCAFDHGHHLGMHFGFAAENPHIGAFFRFRASFHRLHNVLAQASGRTLDAAEKQFRVHRHVTHRIFSHRLDGAAGLEVAQCRVHVGPRQSCNLGNFVSGRRLPGCQRSISPGLVIGKSELAQRSHER